MCGVDPEIVKDPVITALPENGNELIAGVPSVFKYSPAFIEDAVILEAVINPPNASKLPDSILKSPLISLTFTPLEKSTKELASSNGLMKEILLDWRDIWFVVLIDVLKLFVTWKFD